jgi:hypothetical protein
MERFVQRHQGQIIGLLSGFDRVLFRGTLPSLNNPNSLTRFLHIYRILFKDFGRFVQQRSEELKAHAQALAQAHGRPYRYLRSPGVSKEAIAQEIAQADGITDGLVCVLACVETATSFRMQGDWKKQRFPMVRAQRQCLHFYFYFLDRDFGLIHVRLQSWIPFTIQVCVNGREWLARQLAKEGIACEQRDNCFAHIADLPRAQQLLDELTTRDWVPFLKALAQRVNPLLDARFGLDSRSYYWTIRQSEYATDVMFQDAASLHAVYPKLVSHAIQCLTCEDVLRFLGRHDNRALGQVTSDVIKRLEGTRVKHRVEENSLKMYDKQACVLRVETTINDPHRFRVYRERTRRGKKCMSWLPMRKGVVDCARRASVCRQANERYFEALAVVGLPQPIAQTLDPVSRRITKDGRPYRPLRPVTPAEAALFRAVLNGQFLLQGFRNRQVRALLEPGAEADPRRRRQASGRVTRWLRLLRAHGLIRKVPTTRYYRITAKGQQLMTLALKLRDTDLAQLAA